MEFNLSYNTLCGLRDCVKYAFEAARFLEVTILSLPTDDNDMQVEILEEYFDMLDEFIEQCD